MTDIKIEDNPAAHSNLYIKNIPPEVDNDSLKQIFQNYGTVVSCRVVKNPKNPGLNSYGFVKMNDTNEATIAIERLNGATLNSQTLEVKYAQLDAGEKTKTTNEGGSVANDNLYVRNVPVTFSEDELRSIFQQYGEVKEVKILPSGDAARGNGALIRFGTTESAGQAIAGLHNNTPPGGTQPLQVRYADTPQDKVRKVQKQSQMQSQRFSMYGNQQNGAAAVSTGFNNTSQQMYMNPQAGGYAAPGQVQQAPTGQPSSVYVCNLTQETDKLLLYEKFGEYGGVKNIKVLETPEGKCKGVAFINYTSLEAAQRAIASMNGATINGQDVAVSLQTKKSK